MLRAFLRVMLHDAPNNVASMVLQNIACIFACIVSCDDGRNVENNVACNVTHDVGRTL